jgi:nucleoside-diphosphate-sugar epimerase
MQNPSTVLILGARGRFGQAVARAFVKAGWQVHGQIRPGAKGLSIPGVKWLPISLSDFASLSAASTGATVVVNALNPVYTHKAWSTEALPLLESAIRVTRELNATLIQPGNVYNFGEEMPAVLKVDTAQVSKGVKGRIRIAMEKRLQQATNDGALRAIVLRAGDFFGTGTGTWLDQAVAKDLKKGRITWPGKLDVATPWAYLPDLALALVRVAERGEQLPAFSQLHFTGHTATGQEWINVLTSVARENGWLSEIDEPKVSAIPWALFRLLGPLMPTFAALAEMQYLWRTPHRLDNQELRSLIGDEPRTGFEDAVRQSLLDIGLSTKTAPVSV